MGRVWAEDSATHQRPGSCCSDLVHDVSETDHLDGFTVTLLIRGRGVLGLSETARTATASRSPYKITARPPGGKNSIQPSMDLSRIPSFYNSGPDGLRRWCMWPLGPVSALHREGRCSAHGVTKIARLGCLLRKQWGQPHAPPGAQLPDPRSFCDLVVACSMSYDGLGWVPAFAHRCKHRLHFLLPVREKVPRRGG